MKLSPHLFWDTDISSIDFQKNARPIIERVVTRGRLEDWWEIVRYYGLDRIKEEVVKIRAMDIRTMTFLSTVLQIPQAEFRCYKEKQSILKHYPY
jgi:hypothetical protein